MNDLKTPQHSHTLQERIISTNYSYATINCQQQYA